MIDAVIIGGGAAGLLTACVAASREKSVVLLEPNDVLGRKLRITGKGRCNVTNNCAVEEAVTQIPTGGKFLRSALHGFSPQDAMEYFENLGVPLKTERGRRVFPVSDNAHEVADALARRMKQLGVTVIKACAESIEADNGAVRSVVAGGRKYTCGSAVIATGGVSYPKTGSTGDGYRFARDLGHTVIAPQASLVPLESPDEACVKMQGLSLRNVRLTVYDGGKKPVFSDFGELLFTHFGISGPLVLSASAHMRDFGSRKYRAVIDLKPALDDETLERRILRDFEKNKNRDFANSLSELVNRLMIPIIVERSGIAHDKKVHSITRAERERLKEQLRRFEVRISGPRPVDEAVITSGGVDTREIVPATMESKLVRGLFFAGEVLNCDAYTGGYNLQIAWSTAFAAGNAV